MKPTLPSRSASSRFADALRATGYGARPSAFRTSRRSRSRFLSAATAVVLVTSVIYAFTAIFTHASADASSYQDWPMFLQNPAQNRGDHRSEAEREQRVHSEAEIRIRHGRPDRDLGEHRRHHRLRGLLGRLRVRRQHPDRRADLEAVSRHHHRPGMQPGQHRDHLLRRRSSTACSTWAAAARTGTRSTRPRATSCGRSTRGTTARPARTTTGRAR